MSFPDSAFVTPTGSLILSDLDLTSPPPAPKPRRYRIHQNGANLAIVVNHGWNHDNNNNDTVILPGGLFLPPLGSQDLQDEQENGASRVPTPRLKRRRSSARAVAAAMCQKRASSLLEPRIELWESFLLQEEESNDGTIVKKTNNDISNDDDDDDIPYIDLNWADTSNDNQGTDLSINECLSGLTFSRRGSGSSICAGGRQRRRSSSSSMVFQLPIRN